MAKHSKQFANRFRTISPAGIVALALGSLSHGACASKSETSSKAPQPPAPYQAPHCDDSADEPIDLLCLLGKKIPESLSCSGPQGRTSSKASYYQWALCEREGKEFSLYQYSDTGKEKKRLPDTPVSAVAFDLWEKDSGGEAPELEDLVRGATPHGCKLLESANVLESGEDSRVMQCEQALLQFFRNEWRIELKVGTEAWFRTYYEATGRSNPPQLVGTKES